MTALGPVFQIAYVVPSIDAALAHWTGVLGVGPFFRAAGIEYAEHVYRGRATDTDLSIAWAYSGDTQIELIQQHNDAPSIYRDFVTLSPDGGQQHLGVLVNDLPAAVREGEGRGLRILQHGATTNGIAFAYLGDDGQPLGTVIELLQRADAILAAFKAIKAAADAWDGVTEPVRPFPSG